MTFQSTPSGRKATATGLAGSVSTYVFQSTPSGRKATITPFYLFDLGYVSIHAFREEGDKKLSPKLQVIKVSIHAFREEGDVMLNYIK